MFYMARLVRDGLFQEIRHCLLCTDAILEFLVHIHLVQPVEVLMKMVERHFILNPKKN